VDNAVYSFGAQLSNGIPITPFKEDKEDTEFLCLMNYLENIKDLPDMREANSHAFKMEHIHKFNLDNYIAEYDYALCGGSDTDSEPDDQTISPVKEIDFNVVGKKGSEGGTQEEEHPYGGTLSENHHNSKSAGSRAGRLPKSINAALDGFSMKMAKTKSFHSKLSNTKLLLKASSVGGDSGTKSEC